ncbi:MAG TPA: futalosine hydrolase [Micromonosporaceae bacterium]|nr:futalosine hydrolase [Micromonosporaceae bacterium]
MTRLLVVTAVDAECDAVLDGLAGRATRLSWPSDPDGTPAGAGALPVDTAAVGADDRATVDVVAAGVGAVAAAAAVGMLAAVASAADRPYTAMVDLGIAGGFADRAGVGDTVIGTASIAADLGADSPDGFLPLATLGFGIGALDADPALVARLRAGLPAAAAAPILSVSTVTGTAERAAELRIRYPDAGAEAMEGFGVASVARMCRVPFVEIRTVSNLVGPRDRAAWRIPDALKALTEAARAVGTLVG